MPKTGHFGPVDPPEKSHHMANFDLALKDALSKWDQSDGTELKVTFAATVSRNPGGIKEYHVTLSP
jgi:hypothetical protein